jgi:hypothetical protein
MSRARNLADLLDASGDVVSGALDNVPPSNDASALTTGTLPVARVPYVGRRNLIINGAMQVAQRGTSATWSNGSAYRTLDRWSHDWSMNGSMTSEQVTDAPDGFDLSLKCTVATPSTDNMSSGSEYFTLRQAIEGYNSTPLAYGTSSAKTITLSFWVKASTAATYAAGFRSNLAGTTHGNFRTFSIDAANTWEYKTLTYNPSTSYDFSNRTTLSALELHIALSCSSNLSDPTGDGNWNAGNYIGMNSADGTIGNFAALSAGETFQITGVQLEVGSVATPFEHRSYGEELALCQRYFQQSSQAGGNPYANRYVPIFRYNSAGEWYGHQEFPVPMRSDPTMTTSTGSSGTWGMWWNGTGTASLTSGLPTCDGSRHGFHFYLTNNVSTVGYGGMTTHGDGSSSYRWEWFADAEL